LLARSNTLGTPSQQEGTGPKLNPDRPCVCAVALAKMQVLRAMRWNKKRFAY